MTIRHARLARVFSAIRNSPVNACMRIAAAAANARIGVIRGAPIGGALTVAAAVLGARPKDRRGTIAICSSSEHHRLGSPNLAGVAARSAHADLHAGAIAPFFVRALVREGFRLRAALRHLNPAAPHRRAMHTINRSLWLLGARADPTFRVAASSSAQGK